jgi:hypothetical protein
VNSKEENSSDFCLDFVKEFGLWSRVEKAENITCLVCLLFLFLTQRQYLLKVVTCETVYYRKMIYYGLRIVKENQDFLLSLQLFPPFLPRIQHSDN